MSQAFSEERIRQLRSLLPKRKSAETPEKLSDKEQAVQRIMTQKDPRFPAMAYPGSAAATADTLTAGIPPAAKVRAEEQKVRRQTRMDKQQRLREVGKEIRDITLLLNKRVIDKDGNVVFGVLMDPEDKIEFENQRAALKKEKAELEGKTQGPPAPKTMSLQGFVQDFTREEGREPTEEELEFFRQQGYWR